MIAEIASCRVEQRRTPCLVHPRSRAANARRPHARLSSATVRCEPLITRLSPRWSTDSRMLLAAGGFCDSRRSQLPCAANDTGHRCDRFGAEASCGWRDATRGRGFVPRVVHSSSRRVLIASGPLGHEYESAVEFQPDRVDRRVRGRRHHLFDLRSGVADDCPIFVSCSTVCACRDIARVCVASRYRSELPPRGTGRRVPGARFCPGATNLAAVREGSVRFAGLRSHVVPGGSRAGMGTVGRADRDYGGTGGGRAWERMAAGDR